MFRDLRVFIKLLDSSNELIHIQEELSTEYEIAAALRYVLARKRAAVLFEKVKGYEIPIVGNLLGTKKRLAIALGVGEQEVDKAFRNRRRSPIKPKIVTKAPAQEVIVDREVDICKTIPVLKHHEEDAGPYFTSALTIARDPETGVLSMGLHRIQVKSKDTIGIYIATPPLSDFVAKAKQKGKPLDIVVASGVDLFTFLSGCTPAPAGINKFDAAGGLAQAPIELVRCHSVNLEAPANAEFLLEGELFPDRCEPEGPFGESTGYYFTFNSPIAKIKVISHRHSPIYHALLPFSSEDNTLLRLLVAEFFPSLQSAFPCVQQVNYRSFGSGLLIVQIKKTSEKEAINIIEHLLPIPWVKIVMVIDEDVDIWNPEEVDWALSRVHFNKALFLKSELPGIAIDPVAIEAAPGLSPRITKIGINATKPLAERERFKRIDIPSAVKRKVATILKGIS
jgi:2,5-furandicarboxylate decarboxylase 1